MPVTPLKIQFSGESDGLSLHPTRPLESGRMKTRNDHLNQECMAWRKSRSLLTVLQRVGNDHSDLVCIEARLFFPVGTLSQRWLSVNMAQLLGLWGPTRRQVCRDPDCLTSGVMALSESFLKPLVVGCQKASLASLSP